MGLDSYISDPAIPAETKVKGLMSLGWNRTRAELAVRYGQLARFGRREVGGLIDYGPLGLATGPRTGTSVGRAVAPYVVPKNLEQAGEVAGSLIPGGGVVKGISTEAGGIAGGMAQGRGLGESALRAAPAALTAALLPWFLRKALSSRIARGISGRISSQLSRASRNLFSRHFTEEIPATADELADFFEEGGPAHRATAQRLARLKNIFRTQPAFTRAEVPVPFRSMDPVTKMPGPTQYVKVTIPDAMDYQEWLYGRGFGPNGLPRGGMNAIPDRALAAQVRKNIGTVLQRIHPQAAADYIDLAHDYGVAQSLKKIVTKDVVVPEEGLINHEALYHNAYNPKEMAHLNSLIGPEQANIFRQSLFPGRQRVFQPESGGVSVHGLPGVPIPARAHIHIPEPPSAPSKFTPWYQTPGIVAPLGTQAVSGAIEEKFGED